MGKGGNQNWKHTDFANVSDEELKKLYKTSTGKEKAKLNRELKARGIKHSKRKR